MNESRVRWIPACAATLLVAGCGGGGSGSAAAPRSQTNAPPTLGAVADQNMDEDAIAGPIELNVDDAESPADSLTLSARSSDTTVLPDEGIEIVGDGARRSMALVPATGQSGTATVTLEVVDGDGAMTATAFDVVVNPLFRGEFSSWVRGVVLVPVEFDEPIGVDHADGTPLTDVEDIPRIKFSDDSADDPTAYDDLLPAPDAPPFED